MFVGIGGGSGVRADEVVAVHCEAPEGITLTIPARVASEPKCVILLRNGQMLAGYLRAETIINRVEQALRGRDQY